MRCPPPHVRTAHWFLINSSVCVCVPLQCYTSKTCWLCMQLMEAPMEGSRNYKCSTHGEQDRDLNAAMNIMEVWKHWIHFQKQPGYLPCHFPSHRHYKF